MTRPALLLLTALALSAALLPGLTISQSLVDADDLSVGDRFSLNIRADGALDKLVVPDTLSNFQVLKVERITRNTDKAWFRLIITPLLPGSQSFPSLGVEPVLKDGKSYQTNRFRLNIIPVRAQEDTLLVDIKPVQKYPLQIPLWGYLLLLLLLLVFLLLAYRLGRKKPEAAVVSEQPVQVATKAPDPAWKIAVDELDALLARDLAGQGNFVQHHYLLSLILRRFMERKYRFGAVEMTSSEIRRVIDRFKVEKIPEVMRFLSYCDRVKFARFTPSLGEVHDAEAWLREWLLSYQVLESDHLLSQGGNPAPLR